MEPIVRAVDLGFGNTKFITGMAGSEVRCGCIPSLAYPSTRDPASLPAAERRKTLAIPINGLFYEVGPDAALATDNLRATHLHDRYVETPEYLALLRGALAMMKLPVIDVLVVGLPVSHFVAKKAALERVAHRHARYRRWQGRDRAQDPGPGAAAGCAGVLRGDAPEDGDDRA